MSQHRSGLTVLELTIVMAVIATILGFVLPAVHAVREAARNQQCLSRLHQLGIGLQGYHDVHRSLPPGWRADYDRESAFGWGCLTLPFIEQQSLHARIDFSSAASAQSQVAIEGGDIPIFLCPSDYATGAFGLFAEGPIHESQNTEPSSLLMMLPPSNYVGIFGNSDPDDVPGDSGEGAFVQDRGVRFAEFNRGLSQTLLVGERTTRKLASTWYGVDLHGEDATGRIVGNVGLGPNRSDADECELDSRHDGHINACWCDGHAASIADQIDAAVYRELARRQ